MITVDPSSIRAATEGRLLAYVAAVEAQGALEALEGYLRAVGARIAQPAGTQTPQRRREEAKVGACPQAAQDALAAVGIPVAWGCTVGRCESRWRIDPPGNRSYAGWLQVNVGWLDDIGMTAAEARSSYLAGARAAAHVYRVQGPQAWSCNP